MTKGALAIVVAKAHPDVEERGRGKKGFLEKQDGAGRVHGSTLSNTSGLEFRL
jgi:hypothetical protein